MDIAQNPDIDPRHHIKVTMAAGEMGIAIAKLNSQGPLAFILIRDFLNKEAEICYYLLFYLSISR
jgi:hypothetical protein